MLGVVSELLYKFACFDCSIAFKRKANYNSEMNSAHLTESEITHKCPNCHRVMAFMGRNFAAPSKSKKSEWTIVKRLWEAGFRYCGNGYHLSPSLPKKLSDVDSFISQNLTHDQKVAPPSIWKTLP